jgi:hypothetical protein
VRSAPTVCRRRGGEGTPRENSRGIASARDLHCCENAG